MWNNVIVCTKLSEEEKREFSHATVLLVPCEHKWTVSNQGFI